MDDSIDSTDLPNSSFERELRRSQYEEAWQRLRQLQNMVWQIPSVTAAIDGGLILVAFRYIREPFIRAGLVLIGLFLTTAMFVALVKHRFFAEAELDTIISMENEYDMKHIQIATYVQDRTDDVGNDNARDRTETIADGQNNAASPAPNYWNATQPDSWLRTQSAAQILTYSMVGSIVILLCIFAYTLLEVVGQTTTSGCLLI